MMSGSENLSPHYQNGLEVLLSPRLFLCSERREAPRPVLYSIVISIPLRNILFRSAHKMCLTADMLLFTHIVVKYFSAAFRA